MELNETIDMMTSPDYKERFKAEWHQLQIRIGKLTALLSAWEAGELTFQPKCHYDLLEAQLNAMKVYAHLLQERAKIEGIEL
jgi:hypothetical protein